MTKEELVAVVERAHALWNQSGHTPRELKAIHEAWWDLLGDLDCGTVMEALKARALAEGPPPRPGEVRRLAIQSTVAYMPSGVEAWAAVRDAFQQVQSGLAPDPPLHEAVRMTVNRMGGLGIGLYTNRDRDLFIREYEDTVRGMLAQGGTPV